MSILSSVVSKPLTYLDSCLPHPFHRARSKLLQASAQHSPEHFRALHLATQLALRLALHQASQPACHRFLREPALRRPAAQPIPSAPLHHHLRRDSSQLEASLLLPDSQPGFRLHQVALLRASLPTQAEPLLAFLLHQVELLLHPHHQSRSAKSQLDSQQGSQPDFRHQVVRLLPAHHPLEASHPVHRHQLEASHPARRHPSHPARLHQVELSLRLLHLHQLVLKLPRYTVNYTENVPV
ncbi:hypothetical protein B0O99DRAFT_125550 [Bisporella sp. PMI_857]|nr:hypothetical protein B0O99DRAFT_125550 [Bisporella sp. PMI_857]